MSVKKFLVGVGDVVAMQDGNIVFTGKTLLDSGLEVSTSSTEIRGGQGNQLQAVYYHTGTLNATITETQWSLPLIALNSGATVTAGGTIWSSQSVTIAGGKGTLTGVTNADIASIGGSAKAVYVDYNGSYLTLPLDTNAVTFDATGITNGDTVCAVYLETKNAAQSIIIPANIVPERVRLFITANLSGDTTGASGFIGKATIEIPVFQLSGAQTISMSADNYANTPISGMAISYTDTSAGCGGASYYAKITEYIFDTNWYDNAIALAVEGGDQSMAVSSTLNLKCWYVAGGRSFVAPNADLTYSVTGGTGITVAPHTGVVTSTGSATGPATIKVIITNKATIEASAVITIA